MTQPIHTLIAVNPQRPASPPAPAQIQRSLYLAQALRNMRDGAAREATAESIRTPGALATNLLAEALRRYGQDHAGQGASLAQAQEPDPASRAAPPPPSPPTPPAGPPPVASPLQIANGPNPSLSMPPPGAIGPSTPTGPGPIPAPPADPRAADLLRRGYSPIIRQGTQ